MSPRQILLKLLLLSLLFLPTVVGAKEYVGKVVGVMDGDTVKIFIEGDRQIRVRLAEIDAPEKSQAFGKRSKQALSGMVYGKEIRVEEQDIDRYKRVVGRIYVGELDVNREMLVLGMAWLYKKYSRDKSLIGVESLARQKHVGLWSDPKPTPPWEYRRSKKARGKGKKSLSKSTDSRCGSKRYCKEMTSCEEARFYLNECGLSRLDRDNDSIPCESLCK